MGAFIEADIGKLEGVITKGQEIITEFNKIKSDFETINSTLLSNWKGYGADAYKYETDHIMENLVNVEEVINSINDSAINDIIDNYNKLDEELGDFNIDPSQGA
ncbi:MAG: hypothetical protein PUE12_01530 [Oscillospiraceae bacterium]|nr:hypothetical protein [Oscillospiraceae bacterium]